MKRQQADNVSYYLAAVIVFLFVDCAISTV